MGSLGGIGLHSALRWLFRTRSIGFIVKQMTMDLFSSSSPGDSGNSRFN
jgi:hypothetical protein